MMNRFFSANVLGFVASFQGDLEKSLEWARLAKESARNYTLFNPADSWGWQTLATSHNELGEYLRGAGRIAEARAEIVAAAALEHDPHNTTGVSPSFVGAQFGVLGIDREMGNLRSARVALAEVRRTAALLAKQGTIDAEIAEIGKLNQDQSEARILAAEGDRPAAHAMLVGINSRLAKMKVTKSSNEDFLRDIRRGARGALLESAIRLGRFEEAVVSARQNLEKLPNEKLDKFETGDIMSQGKVQLGAALIGAGQSAEALAPLSEAELYYRSEIARGMRGLDLQQDMAKALYYLALAQPADVAGRTRRRALLVEAAATIDSVSFEARQLNQSKELISWINEARAQTPSDR